MRYYRQVLTQHARYAVEQGSLQVRLWLLDYRWRKHLRKTGRR